MGGEVEACAECSRKCLLIHQKHDPSLVVCSFFKVMFGKHFSDVVYVPPRFTRLTSLVPKETYLEDSSGRKWKVILSEFNGSLAIRKGWSEFIVGHGIQLGDFVVFHYIMGSHFVVQTYGQHGCDNLSLSGENIHQRKKAKTTENSTATNACVTAQPETDETQMKNDVINVEEQLVSSDDVSSQVKITERPKVQTSELPDDTQFVTKQDNFAGQYDRDYLFDLSVFETPIKSTDSNKTNLHVQGYTCGQVFDALQKTKIEAAMKKCQPAEGNKLSSGSMEVKQETKLYNQEFRGQMMAEASLRAMQQEPLGSNMPHKSVGLPQNTEFPAAPGVKVGMVKQEPREFSQSYSRNMVADTSVVISGKEARTNDKDLCENLNYMSDDDGVLAIMVKPEPVDFYDFSAASITKITCSVQPGSESFLELPEGLPMKATGQVSKFQPKLVLLQDPFGRVWPVLYHHRKYGVSALTSGWKALNVANDIQPGDECTFLVENVDEGRFLVQILRHSQ